MFSENLCVKALSVKEASTKLSYFIIVFKAALGFEALNLAGCVVSVSISIRRDFVAHMQRFIVHKHNMNCTESLGIRLHN